MRYASKPVELKQGETRGIMNTPFFVALLTLIEKSGTLLAQERFYEWHWEMHPMWWWGWGIGMMAMMFFFWLLVIAGFIIGLRWLLGRGRSEKDDTAFKILRERYARGEINKEEFEAKKKDLA